MGPFQSPLKDIMRDILQWEGCIEEAAVEDREGGWEKAQEEEEVVGRTEQGGRKPRYRRPGQDPAWRWGRRGKRGIKFAFLDPPHFY